MVRPKIFPIRCVDTNGFSLDFLQAAPRAESCCFPKPCGRLQSQGNGKGVTVFLGPIAGLIPPGPDITSELVTGFKQHTEAVTQ